jgi:hypothetical protein
MNSKEALMAQDPKNYRDPKVTTDTRSTGGGPMRWLWIVLGVIVLLVVLAWLFGWMGNDRVATTTPVNDEVVVEDDTLMEETEEGLATTGTAIEGAVEETGEAIGSAAETTGDAVEGAADATGEALGETGEALEGVAETTGETVEGAAEETGETIDITPEAEAPEVGDDVEVETIPIEQGN